jgi:predicted lactoylglutathione lyase
MDATSTQDCQSERMRTKIFLNLPVADLPRSMAFFAALGYAHNPHFTDDTAACIEISEEIHVMVLTHAKFREFTTKAICDSEKAVEVLIALSCESRVAIDEMVAKAICAGGSRATEPVDYGFMYQNSFYDLDGHHWELFHMSTQPSPEPPKPHDS